MAKVVSKIRSLKVYEQADASFSVDHSTAPNDYIAIPADQDSATFTIDTAEQDPNTLQQYKHGTSTRKFGPKSSTVSFEMPLAPTGTVATASQTSLGPANVGLYQLLDIVMGGSQSGKAGSDAITGSTAGAVILTSGHGTRFVEGGAFAWVNSSSELEIHEIATISTDTVTPKVALSGNPSVGDDINNCTTFYLNDGGSSAQFIVEGLEADDKWSIYGGQSNLTLTTELGTIPKVGFSFTCANWRNMGSAALTGITYSNFTPIVFAGGKFYAQQVGTRTNQTFDITSFSVTPNIEYLPAKSPEGLQTIKAWIQGHSNPVVQGSFMAYFEDLTWINARDNETKYHLSLQINTSNNRGVLISIPNAQITNVSAPQDGDGIMMQEVSFIGGIDSDCSDTSTALRRSPLRIHFAG